MNSDHYGLRQQPFQMSPDARLFYASSAHRRAFAHLFYGLAQREGFVVVTGEVGAGKTTLIDRMCSELDSRSFVVGRIATTQLSGDDMVRMVADAFGTEPEGDKASVLRGITAALRRPGPRHLLIVDEAQGLTHSALEELRMLSNVTLPGQPPLQTILMGQPQLGRMLASPELEQLRQRVLASYHLGPLTAEETQAYVLHRLRGVGWEGRPAWDEAALAAVHRYSGGIPRRINRLCARVMLSGALEEAETITGAMVEITAMELEEDLGGPFSGLQAQPELAKSGVLPALRSTPEHGEVPAWQPASPEPAALPPVHPGVRAGAPLPAGPPAPEPPHFARATPPGWFSQLFLGFAREGRH
jgi:general secretion pathway protein A